MVVPDVVRRDRRAVVLHRLMGPEIFHVVFLEPDVPGIAFVDQHALDRRLCPGLRALGAADLPRGQFLADLPNRGTMAVAVLDRQPPVFEHMPTVGAAEIIRERVLRRRGLLLQFQDNVAPLKLLPGHDHNGLLAQWAGISVSYLILLKA